MIDERLLAQIREEFMQSDCSIRSLSKKYNIPRTSLGRIANAEGWATLRQHGSNGPVMVHLPEGINSLAEANRDAAEAVRAATDKLMIKVNQLLDLEDALAPRDLKAISGALLDMKLLYNLKTDDERREIQLKLKALEKQLEDTGENDKEIVVSFAEGVGDIGI